MSFKNAYRENHIDFKITNIEWEPDSEFAIEKPELGRINEDWPEGILETMKQRNENKRQSFQEELNTITFEYEAPAISVDTAGRFIKHEIIGGSTVRQKIGEDPIEVSVSGVCEEPTARRLDNLRDAKFGTIISSRLPNGSLEVQFASTSTKPLDDGGAVALRDDDGEFLYTFTLSTVEIDRDLGTDGTDT